MSCCLLEWYAFQTFHTDNGSEKEVWFMSKDQIICQHIGNMVTDVAQLCGLLGSIISQEFIVITEQIAIKRWWYLSVHVYPRAHQLRCLLRKRNYLLCSFVGDTGTFWNTFAQTEYCIVICIIYVGGIIYKNNNNNNNNNNNKKMPAVLQTVLLKIFMCTVGMYLIAYNFTRFRCAENHTQDHFRCVMVS